MVSLTFEDLKLQGADNKDVAWETFFTNKSNADLLDKKLGFDLQITELQVYKLDKEVCASLSEIFVDGYSS
jgi:hypothetical protein